MSKTQRLYKELVTFLIIITILAGILLVGRVALTGTTSLVFLIWNLFLAWVPVLLMPVLHSPRYQMVVKVCTIITIILFLPNTFYILTDFIHIAGYGFQKLYDGVLLFIFALAGVVLGCVSLAGLHIFLRRSLSQKHAGAIVTVILGLSSFAIYIGRYLRWNSWDVVVNPLGIVADVSDRFINPSSYPYAFATTTLFFVVSTTLYWATVLCFRSAREIVRS